MSKVVLENGLTAWYFSLSKYVQPAVKNVKESLAKKDAKLSSCANAPLSSNYIPDIAFNGLEK